MLTPFKRPRIAQWLRPGPKLKSIISYASQLNDSGAVILSSQECLLGKMRKECYTCYFQLLNNIIRVRGRATALYVLFEWGLYCSLRHTKVCRRFCKASSLIWSKTLSFQRYIWCCWELFVLPFLNFLSHLERIHDFSVK